MTLSHLLINPQPDLSRIVDDVARQIVSTRHRRDGSFISTPLLYPSGSTVVVRVHQSGDRFFISDMGLGYQEADLMGAGNIYARTARIIAETAGIRFDSQAFFILEASAEQLPSAVVTVANCSLEAVTAVAYRLAERKAVDDAERLYDRLVHVFSPNQVAKDVEIPGASTTKWSVAALVRPVGRGRITVFETVQRHHASIAHATMKFHDLKELEQAPNRVAVVHRKEDFGTWLAVLTQAANVVNDDVPDQTFSRLVA